MFQYGRIILEHHTYCNRKCDWCLAKHINAYDLNNIHYMTEETLNIILNEIYKNIHLFKTDKLTFSLFRYNEPLFDYEYLIKIAKLIKSFFYSKNIETYIYIHTNSDFLTPLIFEKVMEVIDEITINNYENLNLEQSLEKLNKQLGEYCKDLKLQNINFKENNRSRVYFSYGKKSVTMFINSGKDLQKTTRGSYLQQFEQDNFINNACKRTYDCDLKNRVLVIDYDGTVVNCCEISSRIPEHSSMILGNIREGLDKIHLKHVKDIYKEKCCQYCHMTSDICGYIDDNTKYK